MFISRIFNFRYLAVLILLIVLVAAIGNAAALTVSSGNQNVVEGASNNYTAATATITYSIDGSGNVTAAVDFGTDSFDDVSASFDGGTNYTACTGAGANWDCVVPDAAAAASIDLVATAD